MNSARKYLVSATVKDVNMIIFTWTLCYVGYATSRRYIARAQTKHGNSIPVDEVTSEGSGFRERVSFKILNALV